MDPARRAELDARADDMGTQQYQAQPGDENFKTIEGGELEYDFDAAGEHQSTSDMLDDLAAQAEAGEQDLDPAQREDESQESAEDPPPEESKKDKDRQVREKLYQEKYQTLKAQHDQVLANLDAIGVNPLDALMTEEEAPAAAAATAKTRAATPAEGELMTFEEGTTAADLSPAQLQAMIANVVQSNLTPQVTKAVNAMQRRQAVTNEHQIAGESLGAYAASLGLSDDQITEAISKASELPVDLRAPGGFKAVAKVAAQHMLMTSMMQTGDVTGNNAAREIARQARQAQLAGGIQKRGLPARKPKNQMMQRLEAMQQAKPTHSTDLLTK